MNCFGREGWHTNRDILGPTVLRRGVAHPFALRRKESLSGLDVGDTGASFNADRTPQNERVLVEFGRLPRLLPTGRAHHSRDANRGASRVYTSHILSDLFRRDAGRMDHRGYLDQTHSVVSLRSAAVSPAQELVDFREVMPTVPHRVILNHELRGNRRAETEREGRRAVQLSIRECADRRGRLTAILPQKFERLRLRYPRVFP